MPSKTSGLHKRSERGHMKSLIKLQLAVATILLSAASFSSAATASSLDGEWQGMFQCAPSPTDPAKVPAYNTSFNLSVSGVEAIGSRVAPRVAEVLKGVVDADGKLKLSGSGQLKSGEGKPWTTTISGSFIADSFSGKGGIFYSKGNQARDCTVSLSHVGVAQSTVKDADGGSLEVIPKYLELARELVATVKPENNHYEYHANERFDVHWKDEGYKENAVDTGCGGLVSAVFEKAGSPLIKIIRTKQRRPLKSKPYVLGIHGWLQAAKSEVGLTRIKSLNDVEVGDLFIYECKPDICTLAEGIAAEGHITIVDSKPVKHIFLLSKGLEWDVTVIDSAGGPHGLDDTRYVGRGIRGHSGVGRGTYRIMSDQDGVPTGYLVGRVVKDVAARPITFSRPQY